MYCSRTDRRQKCKARAWREYMREMRWDGWLGYLFPVTCSDILKPTDALVWEECPFCGGLLPLGLSRKVKPYKPKPFTWDAGEGDE